MIFALIYMAALFVTACTILIVGMGWTGLLAIALIAFFAVPLGMSVGR